ILLIKMYSLDGTFTTQFDIGETFTRGCAGYLSTNYWNTSVIFFEFHRIKIVLLLIKIDHQIHELSWNLFSIQFRILPWPSLHSTWQSTNLH
ncbi:hypothetical protein DKP78_16250, partial [Enterococcus faecium]